MNKALNKGEKSVILTSISILLVSVHTIFYYHILSTDFDVNKFVIQAIRLVMTFLLLIFVYKGKNWAKIISIILFSFAIIGALFGLIKIENTIFQKIPFFVMIIVYAVAIYQFGFAKNVKAFLNFQKLTDETSNNTNDVMEDEKFWSIIEKSSIDIENDFKKQKKQLKKILLTLTPNEVIAFDNKLCMLHSEINTWDFWAAAYIINGGCSDDTFIDFREWLIAQGKTIYENALNDIETLTELSSLNDCDWEGLGYIPSKVYYKLTSNEMPDGITIDNNEIKGTSWNENELKMRYPKLWSRFSFVGN